MRSPSIIFTAVFSLISFFEAVGQTGFSLNLKKPKEYEDRLLRSERSDQKKFNLPRRFIQNTVTHYNYVFNANNKLNEIIQRAKASFTDDYSQLLPFYNYTLDATAADSVQLDSLSYKSQTGIVLHDLRNDWIDNLYLLWGASYYLRKEFDSAYTMFQFINYAFAEKEKDGYYKTIGSNRDGNAAFSISTKEKNSLARRMFSEPPSRNEAFIWQIRNFLAQDKYAQASSLIVALRNDPVFPDRLRNDLEEVQAYLFYKQHNWDSAAVHLEKALGNAVNLQERARWEYLLAQLYEMTGRYSESEKFYSKAIGHTTDPILEIYARLYSIRVNRDSTENYINRNISDLLRMARRDKYEDYRDIIYYMAAQMELERNNIDGALPLLVKSTRYSSNNSDHRNKAFLKLAELSFARKEYRLAYNYYDSLRMDDPNIKDPGAIAARKAILEKIAGSLEIIDRQDSLQRIASMPEEERMEFVRKLARQLRKAQGLKDEGFSKGSPFAQAAASDLFTDNQARGEWYFYNQSSRSKGQASFRASWGTRPNTDNWRRASSISGVRSGTQPAAQKKTTDGGNADDGEITSESLYNRLPLTPEAMKLSNDSIMEAMFVLGKSYVQDLEDCSAGTATLEDLRTRFPDFAAMEEVLFNLYYCYHKHGEQQKAAALKQQMQDEYAGSKLTSIIISGQNPASRLGTSDATRAYEEIYDLFIEGLFDEAVARKKIADSLYSGSYWTPQLLYIESVYYIRQREDSVAIGVLNEIRKRFPETPIAGKAGNLIEVLKRRNQIEEELRNLVITRPPEDTTARVAVLSKPVVTTGKPVVITDTVTEKPKLQPVMAPVRPITDTSRKATTAFRFVPGDAHYVALVLNKIDPVFINEAKNAFVRYNRETFYNKQFNVELVTIDDENKLMLISPFADAGEASTYVETTKPRTASQIIPWLRGGKYYFSIISEQNLDLLKENKDLEGYRIFLDNQLPGKF